MDITIWEEIKYLKNLLHIDSMQIRALTLN